MHAADTVQTVAFSLGDLRNSCWLMGDRREHRLCTPHEEHRGARLRTP
jgi:hypothetical protein